MDKSLFVMNHQAPSTGQSHRLSHRCLDSLFASRVYRQVYPDKQTTQDEYKSRAGGHSSASSHPVLYRLLQRSHHVEYSTIR